MSFTNLKVVRVMSRCNLNNTCTEFHINIFIGYNRDFSVDKRKHYLLANDVLVSVIVRVYGNCSITKHCLRTCSCKFNISSRLPNDFVFHVPKMARLVLMNNFSVRNRSLTDRTPVNDTVSFID